MKKVFVSLLAVLMVLALAACSQPSNNDSSSTPSNSNSNSDSNSASTASNLNVSVFLYDNSDTYIASMRQRLEKIFGDANIPCTVYDAGSDQAKQTTQVDTALTQGSNLLIVNIVTTGSEEAAQNIVDAAKDKGAHVIFFNREVADSVINSYDKCVFVGTDADEAGYMQGEMIAAFLDSDGNFERYDVDGDGEISYVMIRGELGNAEAAGRTKYSVLKANELLTSGKLVPSVANQEDTTQEADGVSPFYLYGNWSSATTKNLLDTALTTYSLDNGDIEMIISNSDDMALGAIEAVAEKGYNTGAEGAPYIPVFGVDANISAQDAINNHKMTGTVKQDGDAMAACIQFLTTNVQAGKEIMDGTDSYNVDENAAKIRIPYGVYPEN